MKKILILCALIVSAFPLQAYANVLLDLFHRECQILNDKDAGIYCDAVTYDTQSELFLVYTRDWQKIPNSIRHQALLVEKRFIDLGGNFKRTVLKHEQPHQIELSGYLKPPRQYSFQRNGYKKLHEYCKTANDKEWFCTRDRP